MSETKTYFGNVVLLLFLSVATFLVFKSILPKNLFPEVEESSVNQENILIDNLLLEAIAADGSAIDSTDVKDNEQGEKDPDDEQIHHPDVVIAETDMVDDPTLSSQGYTNLSRFYAKLHKLETTKKGKVRIAYFGDSMNDGDFIVQDIRKEFQDQHGGQGVGFVAVTAISAGARYSVAHQFSKNWKTQAFINVKKPQSPFGISGQVFFGSDSTSTYWVKYKAQGAKHCTQLYNPTLIYGRSNNTTGYINIDAEQGEAITKELTPTKLLNTMRLTSSNVKSLKIDFQQIDSIPIYGVNFDDGQGVHVDNFSLRGNSGLPLSMLSPSLMNAFDQVLNYDLVILQYGANVLSHKVESYKWYESGMSRAINNIRKCFPNADILVISTADKATKIEGEMQTDPATELLLNAQKRYARKTNSGFVNLYRLMGGNGSMIEWVDNNLAAKDYTHFSAQGSRKIAKLIYNEMTNGYTLYKRNAKDETEVEIKSETQDTVSSATDTLGVSE